ncbi:hypothetical protein CDD83_4515 [Cordyceps sp. RAO-2017]|nr:hypothetical protein CDD83_4515 [Cordyceps sp. RAO-2017]
MLFAQSFVAALVAAVSVSAAPTADETWALRGLHRDCAKDGKACTWTFNIDNNAGNKTACTHVTESQNGKPASQSHGGPTFCSPYRLESSWDQRGFSVIGVLDQGRNVIGYFGYDDKEVPNGRVVSPDHTSVIKPFTQPTMF